MIALTATCKLKDTLLCYTRTYVGKNTCFALAKASGIYSVFNIQFSGSQGRFLGPVYGKKLNSNT